MTGAFSAAWMSFDPQHIIATYGYYAVGGMVGLESLGVPLPGETTLIAAATLAGATHTLSIAFVVAAAAGGAIIGDSIGFWIGRGIGFRLFVRYGRRIGLGEGRIKLGQYLFHRHGAKVVFFGRFIAILRTLAALLAGINRMPWTRFLPFNAAGGILWACLYGFGAFYFGKAVARYAGPVGIVLLVLGAVLAAFGFFFVRRNEKRLIGEAEAALPGPLVVPKRRRSQPGI